MKWGKDTLNKVMPLLIEPESPLTALLSFLVKDFSKPVGFPDLMGCDFFGGVI
jgi:hypothetical protein